MLILAESNSFAIPLRGIVEAGFASPAEEDLGETLSFDEFLIEHKDSTYLLEIDTDAMSEAHIDKGDIAIVERGREPRDGDIVVAEAEGEWTLRYFRKTGNSFYLEAANPAHAQYSAEEVLITAVLKAIIRKY